MNIETREGLFAVMEQIAAEREAARPIVEKLVASGEPVEDIEIPEGWRTAGMVMELCDFAFSRLENDPLQSLAFAQLSLAIAGNLGEDMYPSTLRAFVEGRAWKEVGYANRFLNTYDAASGAYRTAETFFSSDGALAYDEAVARFLRAGIFFLTANYDEALALNAACSVVFRDFGDQRREVRCDVLRGMASHVRGDFETARAQLETALESIHALDDLHTLGITYNALARVYLLSNRRSDAVVALERSKEIFTALDMPSDINRADWGLALILMETDPVKALSILSRLRDDYLHRHMPENAGEVGLCMVDALVATEQVKAARILTAQVLKEFIDANLDKYAISALAYLRDILQTTTDPRAAVHHVRSYVERLRTQPALLFLPLDNEG